MTTERRWGIAVILVALVAGGVWWGLTADDRRVDAACDLWVGERLDLAVAVSEVEEATERAAEVGAATIADHFNDYDRTHAVLQHWVGVGPDVSGTLHSRQDWGDDEHGAVFTFEFVHEAVVELLELVESGGPEDALFWIDEGRARLGGADETCLYAARD